MEVRYVVDLFDNDAMVLTTANVNVEGNAPDTDGVDGVIVAEMDGNRNVEPGV